MGKGAGNAALHTPHRYYRVCVVLEDDYNASVFPPYLQNVASRWVCASEAPGLRPGLPRGPAGAAGWQTLHTKLPYITPSMAISSNKE